jgi:hypothetical protein
VFAPANYKKGRGTLEPADLAWACNECVVLLWMHESERASTEKLIEHNIKQSRGWMRAWSGGQTLTGSNDYQRFEIKSTTFRHVVVLSVVSGANAVGRYESGLLNEPRSSELGVTMAATLPAAALEEVVRRDGGLLDLLHLVHRLDRTGSLNTPDCIHLVAQLHVEQTAAGVARAHVADGRTRTPTMETIFRAIQIIDLRAGRFAKDEAFRILLETLNDLDWRQSSELIGRIALAITALETAGRPTLQFELKLADYTWMIGVHRSLPGLADFGLIDGWRESPLQNTPYPPILLTFSLDAPLIVSSHHRRGPSQTEGFLDSIAASHGNRGN